MQIQSKHFKRNTLSFSIACLLPFCVASLHAAEALEEVVVIGMAPGSSLGQRATRFPFSVQSTNFVTLENSQSLDLSDLMNTQMSNVSINSAQNNPLQPDIQFRGFTASPLLGLSQGIAVYQDGVRMNEPLGDTVNWDLLPESAVYSMDIISGANPVFGLNTLGGALAIKMKDGFNFPETQIEAQSGSWGRNILNFESGNNFGLNNGSEWSYYINTSYFEEGGWRDLSDSDATNIYSSLGWRDSDKASLNLSYQEADSNLRGNGPLPIGQISVDRSSIFTAPDITENDLKMFNLQGAFSFSDKVQFNSNIFWRENLTHSFNGDGSEFEICEYSGGLQSLFEEADDIEDELEDQLGIELDAICDGEDPSITNLSALEDHIENQAILAGLDPEDFELEDVSDDLVGTGILSDDGINNMSDRTQLSQGFNAQLSILNPLFDRPNVLLLGSSYFKGDTDFHATVELANMDPITRSTFGLGTGTFYTAGMTDVRTQTKTASLYFIDTMDLSDKLVLTLAARYNETDIRLRDLSGKSPELNGDHYFSRVNPSLGFSYSFDESTNIYASYSESNRVPTPIELACNEGVFEIAREFAIARGDDPDDIDFECRLPNAFLADPPLDDVVTKSMELGIRGDLHNIAYQLGAFSARNKDDILFQTTGRSRGLFANVDETRRQGIEASLQGTMSKLDWYANWSYTEATFQDDFFALSPNHPNANDDGEIAVNSGDRMPGLPEHIIKLGGDYHFASSFQLGAELIFNSSQVLRGDESNDLDEVSAYTIVNLRANYTLGDQFTIFAKVSNVFDKEYENFGLIGEDPTEVLTNLSDNSPLFLGVGAPRAAWVGMRYRF